MYVEDFSKVKLTVAQFQKLLSFFVASSINQQQRIVQIFRTSSIYDIDARSRVSKIKIAWILTFFVGLFEDETQNETPSEILASFIHFAVLCNAMYLARV